MKLDLINPMISAGDSSVSDEDLLEMERSACPTCGSCSGMFTANSMNCLTEALGLSLPGNGTVLATHSDRRELFREAGRRVVDLARRCYEKDDESVLPRSIATKTAFENAMRLDIAMGGSTNTVLHILAAAREGEVDFTMADIDRLSRSTPNICKVAPSTAEYHVEDVHRAGGIMGILGELDRGGLLDTSVSTVHSATLADALEVWDVMRDPSSDVVEFFRAGPAGIPTQEAFSQSTRWPTLDTDRDNGCIRSVANPYNADGGLAVLYGNIAQDGCIVKTAGVDESILRFSGPARVFESQDEACDGILDEEHGIEARDVVVVRYEGPRGGPGMQEMLYPTSYIKSRGLGKQCALFTDGRFSGGTSGLSIGHASPEAAEGGAIALIRDGDMIDIDIPNRTVNLRVDDAELERPPSCRGSARGRLEARDPPASGLRRIAGLRGHGHVRRQGRRARRRPPQPLEPGGHSEQVGRDRRSNRPHAALGDRASLHPGRHPGGDPAVEDRRHDVVGVQVLVADHLGDGPGRGCLHPFSDAGCTGIQSPPEYSGKGQDVVDLIGKVGSAGGHHRGQAVDLLRAYLWIGVRHGKDDRIVRHGAHILRTEQPGRRQSHEHIRPADHFGERSSLAVRIAVVHKPLLGVIQIAATGMDRTGTIDAHYLADSGIVEHLCDRQTGRARSRDNHRHIRDLFVDKFESIPERSRRHDGCSVLVVVKDRNVERLDEPVLNLEGRRRGYVLQIDPTERRGHAYYGLNQLVGGGHVEAHRERIDPAELLEQQGLAFHHGQGRGRTDVPQPEDGGSVGDDGDDVLDDRVGVAQHRLPLDRLAHPGPPPACTPSPGRGRRPPSRGR